MARKIMRGEEVTKNITLETATIDSTNAQEFI